MALAALDDDEILEQPRPVLVEGAHLDRAPGAAARGQEAMAVGDGARRDVLHLTGLGGGGARDGERNDAAAVEEENPAHRTPEEQLAAAVFKGGIPPHQFREREAPKRPA